MPISNHAVPKINEQNKVIGPLPDGRSSKFDVILWMGYALAIAFSISLWFLAIRAPLDLDETGSYWPIGAGFSQIFPRTFLSISFVAYSYILWFWAKLFGSSEIALRSLSVAAMLGAAYLLYRSAREMFDRDTALFAVVIFSLHPIVLFASIDVRPYAFGALAINAAIFVLIRLRHSDSNWLAALFGLLAASILWFQYLFAVILPVLLLLFLALKVGSRRTMWRQFGVALAAFVLAILPAIPGLLNLFRTRQSHVYESAPNLYALVVTLSPGWIFAVFLLAMPASLLVSAFSKRRDASEKQTEGWKILLCFCLGLIPILILYGVSVGTSIHMFAERHRLVAVPGIALCWALLYSRLKSRAVRAILCAVIVAIGASYFLRSPDRGDHMGTWKYALEFVQKNASSDNAPVLICSGYTESNFEAMPPLNSVKESTLFSQLLYYKISVPVIPLPQLLNDEAMRDGSQFLEQATLKHQRFLAMGHTLSYPILEWLEQKASGSFTVRTLAVVDGFEIVEFSPRGQTSLSK